ncbi:sensor histidine kinase [Plesiocystis pacifica SIR-1]|uniref:histidine kinase n=1 Tax=Plesiocystis pacifica SIR-1 TaxID=391625 RepID=A6GD29_9BACT|nr:ATP-binding protein [Plesiocystis pacifica]EDM76187.1 sensor histidine kinase [Plesiocystis pacifica SIR-1]
MRSGSADSDASEAREGTGAPGVELEAPSAQRVRVGFLVASVGMAALLLFVAVSTWMSARELGDAVSVGQASIIRAEIMRGVPPGQAVDEQLLEDTLRDHADLGVSHVGLYALGGELEIGVGEPVASIDRDAIRRVSRDRRETFQLGQRTVVRMAFPLPPHMRNRQGSRPDRAGPEDGQGPGRPPGAGGPGRGGPGRGGPGPGPGFGGGPPFQGPGPGGHLVIEFEPRLAHVLRVRANRSLAVGIAGALLMLLAAVGLWRLSLSVELSERRSAQQRQLAALGEMSAVIAHELRNPLASLKGHAQLLEERLDRLEVDERTRRKVARVIHEAQRLEELSSGLLTFVRLGEIEPSSVALETLVSEALAGLDAARVEVDLRRAPERWPLDAGRMQQVLGNIIDNGLQASAEDQGRVDVRVFVERGRCVFEVRDRGPGVPLDARERIFEPFHTTRTRGTGLGLAVSRRIVELHGGTIGVTDHPEGGAVFRVAIPRHVREET